MNARHAALREEFHDPEARRDYAEFLLNSFIALQIKTLRLQRKWSQEELAHRAGMKQSRISAMEQATYAGWSITTLRRLASAFDLGLIVRFESFGAFLDQATSVSRVALERPSFAEDPAFHGRPLEYTETTPQMKATKQEVTQWEAATPLDVRTDLVTPMEFPRLRLTSLPDDFYIQYEVENAETYPTAARA